MAGASRGSAVTSSGHSDECPVFRAWKALPGVLERISKLGRICYVGSNGVDRQCVIDNADIIEPILREFGSLVCIIHEVLHIFTPLHNYNFAYSRMEARGTPHGGHCVTLLDCQHPSGKAAAFKLLDLLDYSARVGTLIMLGGSVLGPS